MHIIYGSVELNQVTVEAFERRAVFLGKNYVYSRILLTVTAHVSRTTQADAPRQFQSGTGGLLTGGNANGPGPVLSDIALRNNLLQPRQTLVFSFLGTNSLISPLPGDTTDATGGPIPLSCDVIERTPATWKIRWTVQTDLNETPLVYTTERNAPYILAQMVSMRNELNEDYFTRRIIEGTVLFNLPAITNAGLVPDDFRFLLVVPPPIDFKRVKVDVQNDPEEPGLIRYRVDDLQLPFGWAGSHVSRLRASHHIRTTKQAFLQSAGGGAIRGASSLLNFQPGSAIQSTLEGLWNSMPVSVHRVEVDCWGDPLSTRDGLENFARRVIAGRLQSLGLWSGVNAPAAIQVGQNPANAGPVDRLLATAAATFSAMAGPSLIQFAQSVGLSAAASTGLSINNLNQLFGLTKPFGIDINVLHDIAEKHVYVDYTAVSGPITSLVMGVNTEILASPMAGMESTRDAFSSQLLIDPAIDRGPWPATSSGMRGTYIADIIGAVLNPPYTPPSDFPFSDGPATDGLGQAYQFIPLPDVTIR